ncbi:MAG: prolyl oligopeptidase family serine peptidase [Actinomycetota bacterium]
MFLFVGDASADVVPVDVPVLSEEVPRGGGTLSSAPGAVASHTIDGDPADWAASGSGFGGTLVHANGELVYQDHLFDAYGADDGRDAERLQTLDPLAGQVPETYRLDPLQQADIAGQFGVPLPEQFEGRTHYGDLEYSDAADLYQLRVSGAGAETDLLARFVTMETGAEAGLLLLADLAPGDQERQVPFNAGLTTRVAEAAYLVTGERVWRADLVSGDVTELAPGTVKSSAEGYSNAFEARLPIALGTGVRLAAATGRLDGAGAGFAGTELASNLANVAFRTNEPVREWFDKRQALALHEGTIDEFFVEVDAAGLASGVVETFEPGPGYHDRIFTSAEAISKESGRDGIWQHYGVYLPSSYVPGEPIPLQLWLHWRGGSAHVAGALTPRIFKHFGEDQDTMVVSPDGRGSSRWYVGIGHADYREVWADALATFPVDRERVYVSGHSMGGWGSYLLSILYPDRFAAAMPVAGPVTQGAWTGIDFPGCDEITDGENTPCYISANGGDARAQHTRRLLDNLRHVPLAVFQAAADELVPVSGVTRQVERLVQLGYRHRYYLFPNYEHYSHPIIDEWAEGARYMHSFERVADPARVTYIRDMPFERATKSVQSDGVAFDFAFDSAYWMSGLTPVDPVDGAARFDGRSLALAGSPQITVPEAGGPAAPGQSGPYEMTGLSWTDDPTAPAPEVANAFEATLTGASTVGLDLTRMAIDTGDAVAGTIDTDAPLELLLAGDWTAPPSVTIDGAPAQAALTDGVLTIQLGPGTSSLRIDPG